MIELIPSIQSTRSALDAERTRIEIVSQNLANANVTRSVDGQPYKRKQVVFETLVNNAGTNANSGSTIRVSRVESDNRPFREVFKPDHPDADARGYVRYPNVNVHEEMVDLIASSRAFEANIAVVKNARQLAQQAMAIGKRYTLTDTLRWKRFLHSECSIRPPSENPPSARPGWSLCRRRGWETWENSFPTRRWESYSRSTRHSRTRCRCPRG